MKNKALALASITIFVAAICYAITFHPRHVERFQTLYAGVLAIIAAAITAFILWINQEKEIRLKQLEIDERNRKEGLRDTEAVYMACENVFYKMIGIINETRECNIGQYHKIGSEFILTQTESAAVGITSRKGAGIWQELFMDISEYNSTSNDLSDKGITQREQALGRIAAGAYNLTEEIQLTETPQRWIELAQHLKPPAADR